MIGHRGVRARETENTLAAFRRARRDGADGVELDVRVTVGGELVVFHDDDLARLAGRAGRIEGLTLDEVRELRLPGGEGVPELDAALEELGPALLVNVELKLARVVDAPRLVTAVAETVRRHRLEERALVSSFALAALAAFRVAAPDLGAALLLDARAPRPLREGWVAPLLRPRALHPEHTLVTARSIARWRARGYALHTWTVNDPSELSRLTDLGIDGLITDDPARTLALLREGQDPAV